MRPSSTGAPTLTPGGPLPSTFPRNVPNQMLRNTSPIEPFLASPAVSAKQQSVPLLNEISTLLASYM